MYLPNIPLLFQVSHVLLSGGVQRVASPVPRPSLPRLAVWLYPSCDVAGRCEELCHLSPGRLLLCCGLQVHLWCGGEGSLVLPNNKKIAYDKTKTEIFEIFETFLCKKQILKMVFWNILVKNKKPKSIFCNHMGVGHDFLCTNKVLKDFFNRYLYLSREGVTPLFVKINN